MVATYNFGSVYKHFCLLCHLLSLLTFSKFTFFTKNTIRVSSSLDPDQDRCFVRPDLCPNSVQRLSADNKILHRQGKS